MLSLVDLCMPRVLAIASCRATVHASYSFSSAVCCLLYVSVCLVQFCLCGSLLPVVDQCMPRTVLSLWHVLPVVDQCISRILSLRQSVASCRSVHASYSFYAGLKFKDQCIPRILSLRRSVASCRSMRSSYSYSVAVYYLL